MSLRIAFALAAALVAGIVMSFGQTFAPDPIAPLFNSAAPVVALAAAVSMAARSAWAHALLGALAGPLAMVGYYGTSDLRGFGVSMSMVILWCTAGVIAGAGMGLAVWALRSSRNGPMRAVAAAAFPGVAFGEGAHGLIRVADTTPVAYWWVLIGVGVGVLAWLSVARLRSWTAVTLACTATGAIALVLFLVYGSM
ncbi:MAG: DUF6518 family protein [Demequina sp.]